MVRCCDDSSIIQWFLLINFGMHRIPNFEWFKCSIAVFPIIIILYLFLCIVYLACTSQIQSFRLWSIRVARQYGFIFLPIMSLAGLDFVAYIGCDYDMPLRPGKFLLAIITFLRFLPHFSLLHSLVGNLNSVVCVNPYWGINSRKPVLVNWPPFPHLAKKFFILPITLSLISQLKRAIYL